MADEEKEKDTKTSGEEKEATPEGEAGEGGEENSAPPKKKKKLIILGLIVVLILIAVPAGLHFSGVFPLFGGGEHSEENTDDHSGDHDTETDHETETSEDGHGSPAEGHGVGSTTTSIPGLPPPPVTFELDEFLVNLNTPGKQARFLKMTIALELPSEAGKEAIAPYVPRIRDAFQLYLRELRVEDVKGSASLYRLREELMLRLSKVVYPIKVDDILFKEILTQ